MARRKLNTIKFPDIDDTYYLDADKVEFDDSATYAEGSVGEALVRKANIDGYYDELTAGSAEQLISSQFVEDTEPYKFRTTGGSADVGNREEVDTIVGGTIAWNQLINPTSGSKTDKGVTYTYENGIITAVVPSGGASGVSYVNPSYPNPTFIKSHVYYLCGCPANGSWDNSQKYMIDTGSGIGRDYGAGLIGRYNGETASKYIYAYIGPNASAGTYVFKPQLFDLTQMFGSTIADYIYSLEQANAGAGVKWFKSLFPNDYYEYNAGELISVSGLQSHDTVGFNAWDEEWELGKLEFGVKYDDSTRIRTKNYIPILPSTTYYAKIPTSYSGNCWVSYYDADKNYIAGSNSNGTTAILNNATFQTPSNAYFMLFQLISTTTYKNDICINLSWSGWRNGEYEAYQKHSYPLDSSLTLRGVPKLSADNTMYYDGDEYALDGTVTRKYGVVDLGTLEWNSQSVESQKSFYGNLPTALAGAWGNIITVDYIPANYDGFIDAGDRRVTLSMGKNININDNRYETVQAFKTAMNGVMLVYELATPTTETAEPYTKIQNCDDFGTEEYVSTSIVPVGHDTKYPANLRDKLQHLPDIADNDGYYLIQQSNKQMSLAHFRIPQAPSTDGTYVLKATVSGGTPTYTWVEEN